MNIFKKTICLAAVICMATATVACKPTEKVPDNESSLEIYVLDAGYGSQWCADMIELFKQQDWVKEKYPLLTVSMMHNDVTSFTQSKLAAGAKNNTIDLFFGTVPMSYAGEDGTANGILTNLTQSVYNAKVPGEDVLFKNKCLESYNISNAYYPVGVTNPEPQYYFTPWAGGMDGIIYNEDLLTEKGYSVPRTTVELIDVCAKIKAADSSEFAFLQSKEADYWSYLFPIWWAQYESVEKYNDFYNGISNNRVSKDIFKQKGRVESLKVFQSLLDYKKAYLNPSSSTYEFMTAQNMVLKGKSYFHVNGDWFDNEMAKKADEFYASSGIRYNLKMMKTPIISSIINNLPENSIADDTTLSAVVKAIDEEKTSVEGVEDADFAYVKAARNVVQSIGPYHTSCIPSYATGKDVAIDFLRFTATDIACNSYIKSTKGASLPFKYNIIEKDKATYDTLSAMQKARLEYFANYDVYVLPSETSFPLVRYGGLKAFSESNYFSTFSASGNTTTPQDFYDKTISSWSDTAWQNALVLSGIAG